MIEFLISSCPSRRSKLKSRARLDAENIPPASASDSTEPEGSVAGTASEHRPPDHALDAPTVPSIVNAVTAIKRETVICCVDAGLLPIGGVLMMKPPKNGIDAMGQSYGSGCHNRYSGATKLPGLTYIRL